MEACLLVVLATIFASFISGSESTSFTIRNNCPYTIWPATQPNSGVPSLSQTGFELRQGASSTIGAPTGWAGRIWARTFCGTDSSGRFGCPIGDCGTGQVACNGNGGATPASLAEFTLNGGGGNDYYDVSIVDGFNLPMTITNGGCPTATCPKDVNAVCPSQLAIPHNGGVIGCRSASNYVQYFKSLCPRAYTYPHDDANTFACRSGGNYVITFCP